VPDIDDQHQRSEPAPSPIPVAKPAAGPSPTGADFEYVDDAPARQFRPRRRGPRATRVSLFVRALLAVLALGFVAVIGVAAWLQPYDADGQPLRMASHTQLGLQPCSMVVMSGKPCPACGMTTSFALLVHGDVLNSMRANWVGTLMCGTIIVLAPWVALCAIRGRLIGVRNGELFSTILIATLLVLMSARWLTIVLQ